MTTKFLDLLGFRESETDELKDYMLIHSSIENILSSYTDFSDSFAEILQNSLDSILWKIEQNNTNYIPQIYIKLNQEAKTLEIRDNGIGISREDFLSIFKPNFSLKKYKQQSSARGHKGAATTYLQFAHGSYDIYVKDQTGSNHLSLANGAEWLNSFSEYISAGSANETVPEPA